MNLILESTTWSHWLLPPDSRAGIARCVLPDTFLSYGTDGVLWFGPSWAGYSEILEQIKETLESHFSIIFSALKPELKPRVHHSSAPFSHCDLAFCQLCLEDSLFWISFSLLQFCLSPSHCQHQNHLVISCPTQVQINWEGEMAEGLNWGVGLEEPLPSVPGSPNNTQRCSHKAFESGQDI